MPSKKNTFPAPSRAELPRPQQGLPKELKAAFWIALPAGAVAALIVLWPSLFPVAPQQLVEVAWTHRCTCVHGWIRSLKAEGYTVRDFELDDTSALRQRWQMPNSIRGCHPASYLGYFLDGHVSADTLRRVARERPQAIGLQQVDTLKSDDRGNSKVVSSQVFLINSSGTATPWLPEKIGGAAY